MIKYKEFNLFEMDIDSVKKRHQRLSVMDHIKTYGVEPSDIEELYTATDQELELYRRAKYALLIQNSPQPQQIPDNEIWYTSIDGNIVNISDLSAMATALGFTSEYKGPEIISNVYENGKGVITFSSSLTWCGVNINTDTRVIEYGVNFMGYGEMGLPISNISSIILPSSVTSIGDGVFDGCSSLSSITIPDSVTSIGAATFRYCSSLSSITIPDSVTSIGENAFYYCHSLSSITLPSGVTSIENSTFYSCSSLSSITLPNTLTSIGGAAFSDCESLTSITLPSSVTSIGNYTFSECESLTMITSLNTVPPVLYDSSVLPGTDVVQHIYVPVSSVDAYKSAEGWLDYADRIEAISE